MKKKLLILFIFLALISTSFASDKFANKKILITYYSRTGNTETVAKEIQKKLMENCSELKLFFNIKMIIEKQLK